MSEPADTPPEPGHRIPADTAEFLGGPMPTYRNGGIMTIQGKKVDMNKLKDPFKRRDDARAAGVPLPDVLPGEDPPSLGTPAESKNQRLQSRADGQRDFDKRVTSRLADLLDRLLDSPTHARADHQRDTIPKEPGVYLFSDAAGRPIYVGQSRNLYSRLAQHTRESSTHLAASFAFNIARREAKSLGIDVSGSRGAMVARADFNEQFLVAKRVVARMPVQFATEEHADLRTVFEVYATYVLGTQEYNSFETH
jgi:hypothetical protein